MESNEPYKLTDKTRGMDTWNRLTDFREEGVGILEEISQRTYMHICIVHGEGLGVGGWVEGGKGGEK